MYAAAVYTALILLLLTALALNVSRLRIRLRIAHGDGGNRDMKAAIRSHMNSIEQVVVLLPLMWVLAWLAVSPVVIHLFGILMLISRGLHPIGMIQDQPAMRRLGATLSYLLAVVGGLWILGVVLLR